MPSNIVNIQTVIRRMRGGSQAYLVKSEDGGVHVAKFVANPQGTRTVVNEWIASQLFQRLGVSVPTLSLLRLTEDIRDEADLCFEVGDQRLPVQPGLHLGSQCPVDPSTTAIFDFLPSKLLDKVVNLKDFGVAFVLDKWLGKTDHRQAIFVREPDSSGNRGFRAYCIDQKLAFGGQSWKISDQPLNGQYYNPAVYEMFDMYSACAETMDAIAHLNEDDWLSFAKEIPGTWFSDGDYDALVELFASVQTRISNLRSLMSRHWHALNLDTSSAIQNALAIPNSDIAGGVLPVIS